MYAFDALLCLFHSPFFLRYLGDWYRNGYFLLQDHPCIDLCCPHGEVYVESESDEVCGRRIPNGEEDKWTKHLRVSGSDGDEILRAQNDSEFKCPKGQTIEWPHHYPEYENESRSYEIQSDGSLIGTKVTLTVLNSSESRIGNAVWRNGEYCVAYADGKPTTSTDYDDYDFDNVFQVVFDQIGIDRI